MGASAYRRVPRAIGRNAELEQLSLDRAVGSNSISDPASALLVSVLEASKFHFSHLVIGHFKTLTKFSR